MYPEGFLLEHVTYDYLFLCLFAVNGMFTVVQASTEAQRG